MARAWHPALYADADAIARGTAYALQGNLTQAGNEFKKALDQVPGDPTAERYLAWTMSGGMGGGNGGNNPSRRGKR